MNELSDNPQQGHDAYLAGIIDGEGSITRSSGNVRVQVTNTQRVLLELFQDKFGGSIYSYAGHNNGGKVIYSWQVSGRSCRGVLEATIPYLLLKRDKALWGLLALDTKPSERGVVLDNLVNGVPFSVSAAETEWRDVPTDDATVRSAVDDKPADVSRND